MDSQEEERCAHLRAKKSDGLCAAEHPENALLDSERPASLPAKWAGRSLARNPHRRRSVLCTGPWLPAPGASVTFCLGAFSGLWSPEAPGTRGLWARPSPTEGQGLRVLPPLLVHPLGGRLGAPAAQSPTAHWQPAPEHARSALPCLTSPGPDH